MAGQDLPSGGGGAGPNRPRDRGRRGAGSTRPAPNACWQLDATEYVLAGGRKAVIFQLQDDHWRLAVAWLVAPGDGRPGGHRRLRQGRSRPGRAPGARAADNGAAPGPSRRPLTAPPGRGTCAPWASNLSPANPTGPPPTGDNERFGQTLLRYLDQQPLADSIAEPPGRRVDRFDHTLQHLAPPPRPARAHHRAAGPGRHRGRPGTPTGPRHRPHHPRRPNPRATRPPGADRRTGAGPSPPAASVKPAITRNGTVHIGGIAFLVRRALAGHRTTAIWDATTITFAHAHGRHPDPVQLAARRRHLRLPPPARPHQPTRQAPAATGPNRHRSPDTPNVTDVLIQNRHPCPETSHNWLHGSSPLARGLPAIGDGNAPGDGIIPARAGFTEAVPAGFDGC